MHSRRAAAFVLGAWIVGCLFMAYIDAQSSDTVQATLSRPTAEIAKIVQTLGPEKAAEFLRYHSFEEQRRYSEVWGITQLVIGCGLIALLIYATRVNRLAIGLGAAMLVLAAFAYFALAPEIHFLRRRVDLATWSADRARYLALRGTFVVMEMIKLALGCTLAVYLFIYKRQRPSRRPEQDSLDIAVESSPTPGG
jgi:hypothetical protein